MSRHRAAMLLLSAAEMISESINYDGDDMEVCEILSRAAAGLRSLTIELLVDQPRVGAHADLGDTQERPPWEE